MFSSSQNRCRLCSRIVNRSGNCKACSRSARLQLIRAKRKQVCVETANEEAFVLNKRPNTRLSSSFPLVHEIEDYGGNDDKLGDDNEVRAEECSISSSCDDLSVSSNGFVDMEVLQASKDTGWKEFDGMGSHHEWTPITWPETPCEFGSAVDEPLERQAATFASACPVDSVPPSIVVRPASPGTELDMNSEHQECPLSSEVASIAEYCSPCVDDVVPSNEMCCFNCKRHALPLKDGDNSSLLVNLRAVAVTDISSYERKWKTFKKTDVADIVAVDLCYQCYSVLSVDERAKRKKSKRVAILWKDVWPVYMWKFLSHPGILTRHGSDALHWIPRSCHRFWTTSLCNAFPLIYDLGRIDLYNKSIPVLTDVTIAKTDFTNILDRNRLGELKQGCDQYLIPRILCPWGCSAYLHDCGSVSYDAITNRFFPFLEFAGSIATSLQKRSVESVRPDFLSTSIDMHLYNPDWSVHPSIEFTTSEGPVYLTCDTHKGGTTDEYFHLPKTGSCLPSAYSDVLSHAVLTAKTLHRTKACHYSTMYQMNKCVGTYSGIECSHVSENRKFDFISHITDVNEARSFAGRMDIRGLVTRLEDQRVIPAELASSYAERADDLFSDKQSLTNLTSGATMITLNDAMNLQGMLSSHPLMQVTIDCDSSGVPLLLSSQEQRTIKRHWPSSLIHIHPNDDWGAKIKPIPAMATRNGYDYRLLWNLSHALLCVPSLWEQATSSVSRTSQWHGFVLSYLSKKVLGQSVKDGQFKGDPFDVPATDDRNKPCGLAAMLGRYCADKASPNYRADAFAPSDMKILFQEEIQRGVLSVVSIDAIQGDIELRSAFEALKDRCETILIHGETGESQNSRMLPCDIEVGASVYELRFLSSSSTTPKTKSSGYSWKASVWKRHGCGVFKRWWSTTRSPSVEPLRQPDLSLFPWHNLDVAIYVRKRSVSLEKYRREYLRYMGGQSRVGCQQHDVPLIITPAKKSSSARLCCRSTGTSDMCTETEEYHCPIPGCISRICRSCFKCLPEDLMTMLSPDMVSAEDETIATAGSTDDDECDEDCQSDDDSLPDIIVETVLPIDIDDEMDVEASSPAEREYCFDYGNLQTGADEPGFGTGEFAPEVSCEHPDELLHEPLIPTTIENAEEIEIEGGTGIIGTSVLLNKCGTMLVRRDNQLQASRRERNMIEKVASRKDLGTVPLVYLEGILFPSIFWSLSHSVDGGVLGSMPTSLFCQNKTRKRFGVASMADHAKTRLKSIGNTASTDPRYLTFLFDSIANGAIEGQDTRVVLSRGFEESMGPAGMRIRNKGDDLYSDTIDNRQCVHDLCASERDDPADLFVTLTCNQREHFGIRNVKRYIDDGEALENYKAYMLKTYPNECKLSGSAEREVQRSLQEASRTLTVRNWMEIRLILLRYIRKSPEKPLGDVTKLFVRDEYQGDAGNLSHMHMLVTLRHKYSTPEGKRVIEELIRGFVDEIVGVDEVDNLIAEGLIDDWDDYETMKTQAKGFLAHHHSDRCMRRTGPNKNDLVCRVPDARIVSKDITQFSETLLHVDHSAKSVEVMERLGLCKPLSSTDGEFVPERDYLQAKRIYAPVRHGEGNITPVVGRLFAATRSTMNVQICTSNGTTRYVVKYLVKIDENNYVTFEVVQQEEKSTVKAEKTFLHNTKITSSAINEAKKLRGSRDGKKQKGRSVACTEMMQLILGFPQVHCSMEFVRVPTLPLGERPGLERMTPQEWFDANIESNDKDAFSVMVPSVLARENLFKGRNKYRRHTPSQVLMLQDQMMSKVTLDRVFLFGIRPPELLFIDKMEWYFQLFDRDSHRIYDEANSLQDILCIHLSNSPLVDGLGHQLRLRTKGLALMRGIMEKHSKRMKTRYPMHAKVIQLFRKILNLWENSGRTIKQDGSAGECPLLSKNAAREWHLLQSTFLFYYSDEGPLPIVVYSNVKPYNASKFVIHLLLSLGHFQTERDMWMHASMKDAFVQAGLISPDIHGNVGRAEVDRLLKLWIEDQLRYYPVASKKMDEYIVAADNILYSVLIHDAIPINELPPVMYTSLVRETNASITEHVTQCKEVLIDATLKTMSSAYLNPTAILPSKEDLMKATKSNTVHWNHVLPRTSKQSQRSYEEQCTVQSKTASHIDLYAQPDTYTSKNLLIAGPPGVGKTHCLSHGILYALSKGLVSMTTAMLADRAFMLGGRHLHKLFKLSVRDRGSPHRLAELAIISLQKNPELLSYLRRLDVLFVDECGQISAELLSILDIILRKVRDSALFMGGVLVVGTIDQVQLRPINGLPFLLSPYILTTFSIIVLKEYVRCADCKVLQEMNELARAFPETNEEWVGFRKRLRRLIAKHCTFIPDWNDPVITDGVMRIFPKREETATAIRNFLASKKLTMASDDKPYATVNSEDTMVAMESHAEWKTASTQVSSFMNTKIKEPPTLDFYKGAIYQFTHNCPGKFNATQLAFLLNMPSREQLLKYDDIEVYVGPAGTKAMDSELMTTHAMLVEHGWIKTKVGVAPPRSINMWNHGVKAKRRQYGLRHHVASTIHSAIGHTVPKIATELGPGSGLWEKAMVVVLISRVSKASDLIFVGDKNQNINALMKGLAVRNQYDDYMNHVVHTLSSNALRQQSPTVPLYQSRHPFRQKDLQIPSDRSGLVYLIVSVKEPSSFYIGMTQDMGKRIKQHNSGIGARESSDPSKRPWGLLAYVTGFSFDRGKMRQFELRWQNLIQHLRPSNAHVAADLAQRVITRNYDDDELQLVLAGEQH